MQIVIASGNRGKLEEFGSLFTGVGGQRVEIVSQQRLSVPEIEETGLSFVENAILKARNAAGHTGLPAIADDSGLEVDALNGAPGIYSSRYAGPQADDQSNIVKLLADLGEVPEPRRTARFQCVIVFMRHDADPTPIICQGTWEGQILFEPRGSNGFGYDPVFLVPTHRCSSAELPPETKNRISHRGQALTALLKAMASHRRTQPT